MMWLPRLFNAQTAGELEMNIRDWLAAERPKAWKLCEFEVTPGEKDELYAFVLYQERGAKRG